MPTRTHIDIENARVRKIVEATGAGKKGVERETGSTQREQNKVNKKKAEREKARLPREI